MRPDRVQEASFTVLWKIGRTGLRRKAFGIWSGLSESNRHLNLGKVPYYHYTKAAQQPSFYSTTARLRQVFAKHSAAGKIGRASCRERVEIAEVEVSVKKKEVEMR